MRKLVVNHIERLLYLVPRGWQYGTEICCNTYFSGVVERAVDLFVHVKSVKSLVFVRFISTYKPNEDLCIIQVT